MILEDFCFHNYHLWKGKDSTVKFIFCLLITRNMSIMNFDSLYFDTSISLFCVDDKYENTRQKLTY